MLVYIYCLISHVRTLISPSSLVEHTKQEFQGLVTSANEVSHLCNWRSCINPEHQCTETHHINMDRSACFQYAANCFSNAASCKPLCDRHIPPMLPSAVGTTSRKQNLPRMGASWENNPSYSTKSNTIKRPFPSIQTNSLLQLDWKQQAYYFS